MGKGKELEFPEGQGGGKGEPGVPPIIIKSEKTLNTNSYIKYRFHI